MKCTKEELERLILKENKSYSSIGRMYNVSGNAIKKWAKKLCIDLPKRRKISQNENFSHPKRKSNSLVNVISDVLFISIISEADNWREIGKKLGYKSTRLSTNVRESIYERCTKLGIVLKIRRAKDTNERTKGEIFSEFNSWQSARSFIRKKAQENYINSCKPLKCAICGYDKHVEIAHIKAVSNFSEDTTIGEINSIDNLIALCPNHHWEYDSGVLKI